MPGEASPASQPVTQPTRNNIAPNAAPAVNRCAIITLASPSRPRSSHTEAQSADRKLHRYFLVNGCRRQLSFEPPLGTRATTKTSWSSLPPARGLTQTSTAAQLLNRVPSEDRLDGFIGDRFAQSKPGGLVRFPPVCVSSATPRQPRLGV